MEDHSLLGAFVNMLESLGDRPVLLLLYIVGGALLLLALFTLLGKLLKGLLPAEGKDELDDLSSMLYGGADQDGRMDGIPVRIKMSPVTYRGKTLSYEASFRYSIANPGGIKLLAHRAGLLNRPLEMLPPLVEPAPGWLAAAGFALRCAPPEAVPLLGDKVDAFRPFAETGALEEIKLEEGELSIKLSAKEEWPDQSIKALSAAGLAAAKQFQ